MSKYSWGVDGYGRIHMCEQFGHEVILCMLPGFSGHDGVWLLEAAE